MQAAISHYFTQITNMDIESKDVHTVCITNVWGCMKILLN